MTLQLCQFKMKPKKMKHIVLIIILVIGSINASAIKITNLSEIKGNELNITEIDLSNKGLIEFPKIILACKNLQKLNLSNNGFVDIPIQLSRLEHLDDLNFSQNQNLSPIDLDVLFQKSTFKLEKLNLEDCALFYLPEAIAKHRSIIELDISDNYIRVLPYSMMLLNGLVKADFSNNKLVNISWLSSQWWSLRELDVSANEDLESEGLLLNLSFQDNIEKLTISNLDMIPKEFKYFMGSEIVIKNSVIPSFPRYKYSSKIDKITFDNCVFPNAKEVVDILNKYTFPDKISFRRMSQKQLLPFLALDIDSLDLRDNDLTNINPIVAMQEVKWLDIRANRVTRSSQDFVKEKRPDITLFVSEPIQISLGVSPPFPKLIPKMIVVEIAAKFLQVLPIGNTVFEIPQRAFLTAEGKVYNGKVEIEYTEYLTAKDIFLSGISMTTVQDDEPYMLSSGGMFNFEAKDANGNQLQANPNQPIKAQVISQTNNSNMQTWRMNSTGAWVDYGDDKMKEVFKLDQSKLDSIMEIDYGDLVNVNVEFFRDRFVPVVKKGDRLKDFEISFDRLRTDWGHKNVFLNKDNVWVYNRDYHAEYISHLSLIYDGDSTEYHQRALKSLGSYCMNTYKKLRIKKRSVDIYTKEGPNFISGLTLTPDYEHDNLDLKFRFKDSLMNIPVLFKTKRNHYRSKPREIGTYFSKYQYNFKKYVKQKRKNFFKIKPYLKRSKRNIQKRAIQAELNRQQVLFYQKNENKLMLNIGSVERSVTLEGFGLWNCDAKARMVAPTKMASNFSSVAGEMIDDNVTKITLIDKSQNGVVNFDENSPEKFFDRNSKNIIIVFFASAGVGVFRSWIETIKGGRMELNLLDPEKAQDEIESLIDVSP
jgi:hypothetical protein